MGEARHLPRGRGRPAPEILRSRDVPVPFGAHPYGARAQLHDGRRCRPIYARAGPQRAAPDGLGRVRAAGRERRDRARCPPRQMDLRQHRHHARPAQEYGAFHRLEPRVRDLRSRLLPPAAETVSRLAEGGARRPQDAESELGPGGPYGACQRAGDRRARLALGRAGRAARAAGMGVQDHQLRARPTRCAGASRPLAGEGAADAGELDRALGRPARPLRYGCGHRAQGSRRDRSLHHAAGHAVRRGLHRHRARSSACQGCRCEG